MNPMLNIGVRAARAAGRVITKNMGRLDSIRIEKKGHNDFATQADREAEAEIVESWVKRAGRWAMPTLNSNGSSTLSTAP